MKERPILFNSEMVRAILDGRKTQDRRLVPQWQLPRKTKDGDRYISVAQRHPRWGFGVFGETEKDCMENYNQDYSSCCPYGRRGWRLWVRETFAQVGTCDPGYLTYKATYPRCLLSAHPDLENVPEDIRTVGERWRPSIHMPRWASRITLEITGVRVERLQDISKQDSLAEGVRPCGYGLNDGTAQRAFAELWRGINGPDSWDLNPWVWVIEFKRVEGEL